MLPNEILSNEIETAIGSYWRLDCVENRIEITARGAVVIAARGDGRNIIKITNWIWTANITISRELSLASFLASWWFSF